MVANFYKKNGIEARNYKLIASKNIDCIPKKGNLIMFSGQLFTVDRIYFDVDKCEYNLYIIRAWSL